VVGGSWAVATSLVNCGNSGAPARPQNLKPPGWRRVTVQQSVVGAGYVSRRCCHWVCFNWDYLCVCRLVLWFVPRCGINSGDLAAVWSLAPSV